MNLANELLETARLIAIIEANDGEITEEVERELDLRQLSAVQMIDKAASILNHLPVQATALRARARAMTEYARNLERVVDRVKEAVVLASEASGNTTFAGTTETINVVGCAKRLVLNETELPPSYLTQVISYEPDKDRIKKKLLDGESIPGASLEGGRSVRVK